MSPRRPNPKPIPYIAKDGTKTWRIRYRLGTGPAAVNTSETFDTKRDAQDFAADIRDFGAVEAVRRLTDRDAPRAAGHEPAGPTLDGILEDFLTWKAARVRSSRTVEEYRSRYRSIGPTLGMIPLRQLTDAHVQSWVDGMVAGTISPRKIGSGEVATLQPLAAKSIVDRHGLLHSMLDYAARPPRSLIETNPCAHTDLPHRHKKPPRGLRPGEWRAMYAALQQINPDAADLAFIIYATGARFAEATALSTFDAEDDGRLVTLVIGAVIRREAHGVLVRVEDTKSSAGFRRIRLDSVASDLVRKRLGGAVQGGLLFTTTQGAVWRPSHFRSRAWLPAVELANLSHKPTPHGIRHAHVAAQLRAGATLEQVRVRLGHESITTTLNTYGGYVSDVGDDVLERFALERDGAAVLPPGPVIAGELVLDDEDDDL